MVENYFSYFSTKTYVVGTQKNRLNETVLLGTHNIYLNCWVRKYLQFYTKKNCMSGPMDKIMIIIIYLYENVSRIDKSKYCILMHSAFVSALV